jgi:hypothetical protein
MVDESCLATVVESYHHNAYLVLAQAQCCCQLLEQAHALMQRGTNNEAQRQVQVTVTLSVSSILFEAICHSTNR